MVVPMGGRTMSRDAFIAKLGSGKGFAVADDNGSGDISQKEWVEMYDKIDKNGSPYYPSSLSPRLHLLWP